MRNTEVLWSVTLDTKVYDKYDLFVCGQEHLPSICSRGMEMIKERWKL